MKAIERLFKPPQRRLFLVSLLMPLTMTFLIRLEGSQMVVLSYMPYAILAAGLFGIFLGLQRVAAGGTSKFVGNLAAIVVILCCARLTILGRLGLIADSATYFNSLIFLEPTLMHEVIVSLVMLALFYFTMQCFKHMAGVIDCHQTSVYPAVSLGLLAGLLLAALAIQFGFPPIVWVALILLGWAVLTRPQPRSAMSYLLVLIASGLMLMPPDWAADRQSPTVTAWSPYSEVTSQMLTRGNESLGLSVAVNRSQLPVAWDFQMAEAGWQFLPTNYPQFKPSAAVKEFYEVPYRLVPHPKRVLIIGAGTGNDIAVSLSHAPAHIDALEIDPLITQLSARGPMKPYSSPLVSGQVTDARTFLQQSTGSYDLMIVADRPGLTSISPFSLCRQNDFWQTVEAFRLMKARLTPEGCLFVASSNPRRWHVLSNVRNMQGAFHRVDGSVVAEAGSYIGVSSDHRTDFEKVFAGIPNVAPVPTQLLNDAAHGALPSTDNWPFAFVRTRAIPLPYLWCLYLLGAVMMYGSRPLLKVAGASAEKNWAKLQFLLLGTLSIIGLMWAAHYLAIAFGGEWHVAYVFYVGAAGLVCVVNWCVAKIKRPRTMLFWLLLLAALFANVVVAPNIDTNSAFFLSVAPLLAAVLIVVTCLKRFGSGAGESSFLLAGTSIGLLFVNLSLTFGMNALLYLAAGLCLFALGVERMLVRSHNAGAEA